MRCCSDGGVWLRTTREYFQLNFFVVTTGTALSEGRTTLFIFASRVAAREQLGAALWQSGLPHRSPPCTTRSNHCRSALLSSRAFWAGPRARTFAGPRARTFACPIDRIVIVVTRHTPHATDHLSRTA